MIILGYVKKSDRSEVLSATTYTERNLAEQAMETYKTSQESNDDVAYFFYAHGDPDAYYNIVAMVNK